MLLNVLKMVLISFVAICGMWASDFSPQMGFLNNYCADCHDADTEKSGLDISALSQDLSERSALQQWVRLFDKVSSGDMPPKTKTQPSKQEKAVFLAALENTILAADQLDQLSNGRTIMRRLNRTEMQHTLSDLFQMPVDIRDMLPDDAINNGFDNVGAALNMSSVQIENHLLAFDAVLDQATMLYEQPPMQKRRLTFHDSNTVMAKYRLRQPALITDDGVVFFSTERKYNLHAILDQYVVPYDGRYKIRISTYAVRSATPLHLTVRADGGTEYSTFVNMPNQLLRYASVHEGAPQIIEWEGDLLRGHFVHVYPSTLTSPSNKEANDNDEAQRAYKGPGIAVQWVEIEGPFWDQWPPASHQRLWTGIDVVPIANINPNTDPNEQLDGDGEERKEVVRNKRRGTSKNNTVTMRYRHAKKPPNVQRTLRLQPTNAKADAARLLTSFAQAAFRGASTGQVQPYIALAHTWLDAGMDFEQAMRTAYKGILTSAAFNYFQENPGPLDGIAVANRLSYFLWRTAPDQELLAVGQSGRLLNKDELRTQTNRLLADPRSKAFVTDFTGQWLDLYNIDFTTPDKILYPEFDDLLRWSMVEETHAFFSDLLQHDRSARLIVDSDYVMINDRLAELYDIPGVRGIDIRKVDVPKNNVRGGLLTQASVLKVTANGTTTSPILRGKWVLERILGVEPDPPPPGVPAFEPDINGAVTIMDQLKKHRSNETCASCHLHIDPPGVALECFDVIGGFRTTYRAFHQGNKDGTTPPLPKLKGAQQKRYVMGLPVINTDRLADGRSFADFNQFKQLLAADTKTIAKNLTEKLAIFATGAPISFGDRHEIERIVEQAREIDYGVRTLVHAVIQSPLFLRK